MAIPILLFVVGLVLLVKGGDWFVDGAGGIAYRFHLPEVLIGATVVSIGTTLPEVMVSATSALSGHGEIAYGNAIGSIICNTALIAALSVAIHPGRVERRAVALPVIFFFGAAVIYSAVGYVSGEFSRPVGIVLLLLFLAYMVISVKNAMGSLPKEAPVTAEPAVNDPAPSPLWKDLLFLVLGAALIAFGADLLVTTAPSLPRGLACPRRSLPSPLWRLAPRCPSLSRRSPPWQRGAAPSLLAT